MSTDYEFDVFLAHHSGDKVLVHQISNKLKQHGLRPWIDEEQIAPGRSFQQAIQQAIPTVKVAAIILGVNGVGSWQEWEIQTFFSQCVNKGKPVIPVLLPGVSEVPESLPFLQQLRWINFNNTEDATALELLVWGITGIKPEKELKDQSPSAISTETIQPSSFDTDISFNNVKAQEVVQPQKKNARISLKVRANLVEAKHHKQINILFIQLGAATLSIVALVSWFAFKQPHLRESNGQPHLIESNGVKVDYSNLERYLQEKNWEMADEETYQVMLKVAGPISEQQGRFNEQEWNEFSCRDLKEIDQLWSNASGGKLGFSAQNRVLNRVRDMLEGDPNAFLKEVRWAMDTQQGEHLSLLVALKYVPEAKRVEYASGKSPNFTKAASIEGYLPAKLLWESPVDYRFQRLDRCGL
jgi:hypothetical protein